jgi:hypothetical protein
MKGNIMWKAISSAKTMISILVLDIIFFAHPQLMHAQWSNNPTVNNPIAVLTGSQEFPQMVSDGLGGAIIAWEDYRSSPNSDIYAQRISASGVPQWTVGGVMISTANGNQELLAMVSEGDGGAIITWQDDRNGSTNDDIYVQRINASGVTLWTTNGVTICLATGYQLQPDIISDGSGGAIITWQDERNGTTNRDIYAQRINSSGVVQWATNGVVISTAIDHQVNPAIVSDGSGGSIVAWDDQRAGTTDDIYAQRINSSGVAQWMANGVAISTAGGRQMVPIIISDGSGGAIVGWVDDRDALSFDIYAQRINASGVVQWTTNGVAISTASDHQQSPAIVNDDSDGAIITWQDRRSNGDFDIYAQRIDSTGTVLWTVNGEPISTANSSQQFPTIVTDGSGGAIITWADFRSGTDYDIYAGRINASGVVEWMPNGVPISIAGNNQQFPIIVNNGSAGAIITWYDLRSGTDYDIYASHVNNNGTLTSVRMQSEQPSGFSLEQNYPNPFNPSTNIRFRIAESGFVSLKVFDLLGREVATLVNENLQAGSYEATFDARGLASGVYIYRLTSGGSSLSRKLLLTK